MCSLAASQVYDIALYAIHQKLDAPVTFFVKNILTTLTASSPDMLTVAHVFVWYVPILVATSQFSDVKCMCFTCLFVLGSSKVTVQTDLHSELLKLHP